ncbi:unnamed protein product [Sphagnum balticum]
MYLCMFQSERDKVIISNMMTIDWLSIGSKERLNSSDCKISLVEDLQCFAILSRESIGQARPLHSQELIDMMSALCSGLAVLTSVELMCLFFPHLLAHKVMRYVRQPRYGDNH